MGFGTLGNAKHILLLNVLPCWKRCFFKVSCYVVTLMCSTVVSPRGGGKESILILRLVLLKYLGTSVVPLFLPCINIFWGLSCKFYL